MNMILKDSKIDTAWLADVMAKNPPSIRPNGDIFTGPVRLSFPNIFEPGKPGDDGGEGKFGAALLFPPGQNMTLFEQEWVRAAHAAFPSNWDPSGNPIGLHSPFHDQSEKAFGAKPLAGYNPGAIFFNATSKYKPTVVDSNMQQVTDPSKIYPGVWCFAALNVYHYKNRKTGVAFGLQMLMLLADDVKLAGGGGDPTKAFAGVTITAQSNVAARFDGAAKPQQVVPAGIMPSGGHVGAAGTLPVQPIASADDI